MNIKKNTLFFVFFALLAELISAQNLSPRKNEIGISVGYQSSSVLDNNISALENDQNSINYSFNFINRCKKGSDILFVDLNYTNSEYQENASALTTTMDYNRSYLRIGFLGNLRKRQRKLKQRPFKVFLGGQIHVTSDVMKSDLAFVDNSYFITYGLGLSNAFTYDLERHSVTLLISIPIITMISRPPEENFNGDIKFSEVVKDADANFIGDYFALNSTVTYKYHFKDYMGFLASIGLEYQKLSDDIEFKAFHSQFNIGIFANL